jgi:hypothetical protein
MGWFPSLHLQRALLWARSTGLNCQCAISHTALNYRCPDKPPPPTPQPPPPTPPPPAPPRLPAAVALGASGRQAARGQIDL